MNNIFPLHEIVCLEEHYGQKRANAFPPTKTNTYRLSTNSNVPKKTYLPPQEHLWLNASSISQFERNALSCLLDDGTTFKGTITDDEYLRIRNEIIKEYKECLVFMSLSYVYSKFGGSMNNIMKIFSFLEKQNIINNRNLIEECKIMVNELSKDTEESSKDKEPVKDFISQISDEISNDDLNKNCKCNNSASYLNGDKIYICAECYGKGFYDQKYTSSDFEKLDEELIKKKWSKMEEIKLLEAVDNFGDDWKRVAEHVETKNAHDVFAFL
ncbi:SWI/SNF complex subunit SWI3B, partial [Nosema bombycis CQ1]